MKTTNFSITIRAPKEKVWNTMLQPETYRIWTAEFGEGSYYEGSWEQGGKIRFLGADGSAGMTSVIVENRPYQFISIKHLGIIKNGTEDTKSPEAKVWAGVHESYTFDERGGVTELMVDMSGVPAEFEQYMSESWPKALATLKSLCE